MSTNSSFYSTGGAPIEGNVPAPSDVTTDVSNDTNSSFFTGNPSVEEIDSLGDQLHDAEASLLAITGMKDAAAASATAAATSATNSATSASAAASSATSAATSATNADTSEAAALASQNAAATSATAAAGSASAAATSATNAAISATASSTSATNSANSATAAANSATAAATSATNASNSATAAAGSATAAANSATYTESLLATKQDVIGYTPEDASKKGAANGYASLDASTTVPVAQVPALPISKTTGLQAALDLKAPLASPTFSGTVSGVTKAMVGLGNVDNTSDANKPISTATQTALNGKQNSLGYTAENTANKGVANGYAGLGSDGKVPTAQLPDATAITAASVPSTATGNIAATNVQAALAELDSEKAPKASPTFTGTVSGIDKTMVGLGNVDNTSDANKPISTATQTALNLKANISGQAFTGAITASSIAIPANATVGGLTLDGGGTGYTGYVNFNKPGSGRHGYIGYAPSSGVIALHAETNGGYFNFTTANGAIGPRVNGADIHYNGKSGTTTNGLTFVNGTGLAHTYNDTNTNNFVIRTGLSSAYRHYVFDANGHVNVPGRVIVNNASVENAAYIQLKDSDGTQGYVHYNNPNVGMLRNDAGWAFYGTNDGYFYPGSQYGLLHDYVNARAAAHAATRPGYGTNYYSGPQRVEYAWPEFQLHWPGVRYWQIQIRDNGGLYLWDGSAGNYGFAVTTDGRIHCRAVGDVISWVQGNFLSDIWLTSAYDFYAGHYGIAEPGGPWVMTGTGYEGPGTGTFINRSRILQKKYGNGGVYNIALV